MTEHETTTCIRRRATRRAGPLLGVFLVVAGTIGAFAPTTPAVRADDATPTPTVDPTPTTAPDPTPTPTPEPTVVPTPEPTPAPTAVPTVDPSVEPTAPPSADPSLEPTAAPSPDPSADPSADPSTEPSPTPTPSATPSPAEARVQHAWVDEADDKADVTHRGQLDAPLENAARFTVYDVSFQVVNHGDADASFTPVLQVSVAGDWSDLPLVDPVQGQPFYGAADDGRTFEARNESIGVAELRLGDDVDPTASAVAGVLAAGRGLGALTLPAHGYTEVVFAVRATASAMWTDRYTFRLTDAGAALPGVDPAVIVMGEKPAVKLSPGQQDGRATKDPVPRYKLQGSVSMGVRAPGALLATSPASFNLAGPSVAAQSATSPHVQFGLASDSCAGCHAAHTAQGPMLLQQPNPAATTCFTCHDGTGALSDVRSDWTNPALPPNDPATGSYYSHPATATDNHVSGIEDEFAGVSNRHSACADCHQPHLADATKAIQSTAGWSASGAILAPGVGVTNGAAGTAPTYAWKQTPTFEYELCYKCHSGYTTLPAQDPLHPSRWALDKAIEFNPANTSYHPIQAAGTNKSAAMSASLSGTSPYKLWNYETNETVRCVSCHGDPAAATPSTPPPADTRLDDHASNNRGILIAPYRDRTLKTNAEPYKASEFGLCFVCHAEAPMVDDSGDFRSDTNFSGHGFHVNTIAGVGTPGSDIDAPGAGNGDALCSECHYRIHSTALATGTNAQAPRLVNFAPNVRPSNGVLAFVAADGAQLGSCTLSCHGRRHTNMQYAGAP